jgi:hypothetical protein
LPITFDRSSPYEDETHKGFKTAEFTEPPLVVGAPAAQKDVME